MQEDALVGVAQAKDVADLRCGAAFDVPQDQNLALAAWKSVNRGPNRIAELLVERRRRGVDTGGRGHDPGTLILGRQ